MLELPSVENFIYLLQTCRRNKNLLFAKRVHMNIRNNGLEAHKELGNHLVPMLVECGSMSDAQQVFSKLLYRNEYAWTSLIQGYTRCGEAEHALNLYKKMQEDCVHPSRYTFVALLKACATLTHLERGQDIHSQVAKEKYDRDVFIVSTLVDMYAKCGSIVEALRVLEDLPVRDVVSWTALITGYAEHRLAEEALHCLEQMQLEGILPDAVTFVSSLKACSSIGFIDRGREIHIEIAKQGFERKGFVGNTLVDMYANCCSIGEAQAVFDNLQVRDVVSWNALMGGFAELGLGEEALDCLQSMQLEGISLVAVSLVCSLKACGSIAAINMGRQIHSEIAKQKFARDRFVGNALVDMYAKCDSLAEALGIFDRLTPRDVVSWNALVAGYAEHGLVEHAMKGFHQMQTEGVSPNAITFVCSLKACAKTGALDWGHEIHAKLTKEEYKRDQTVGNTLVDMYAKCGSLAEAQDVFDKLPSRDLVSWNALIAGYAENKLVEKAVNFLQHMQLEGVSPNAITFVFSLKAFCSMGAIDWAWEIYEQIVKKGFERDHLVNNTLVNMYAKWASFSEARELLDRLPIHDVDLWNALITGYKQQGLADEALNCLNQMVLEGVVPVPATFICSLKACTSIGAIDRGREIHAEIAFQQSERDPFLSSTLLDMYVRSGSIMEAQEVFNKLPVRDLVLWTAMITGYADHGFPEAAMNCFKQMQLEGMSPDAFTFVASLKACSRIGAIDQGRGIHTEVSSWGLERDPFVGSILVDMHVKCGALAEAHEVFAKLQIQDVVSWTALITGYAEHALSEVALQCFQQMQLEGVSPDVVSWNAVILGFAVQGESERAFELYAQMQEQGLLPSSMILVSMLKACANTGAQEIGKKIHTQIYRADGLEAIEVFLATALINMYGKCGSMVDAQQVFNGIPTKDLLTWNALISGYAYKGESESVFSWFDRMKEEGMQPDGCTFLSVLTVCNHTGLVAEGQKYFGAMSQEYGIAWTIKHHSSIVDLLGRAGQLNDAVAISESMPFQPDCVVWSTVLDACQKLGDVELGRHTFECAVRMGEEDAAVFIQMSNIYASMLT